MKQLDKNTIGKADIVHFADFFTLNQHCTKSWSLFGAQRLITRSNIDTFSELTQNKQWIHTDDERCKLGSPYGSVIAHGLLILTMIPSLLPNESFEVVGHKQRIVRGSDRFRFPAPVYVDEYVRARARLQQVQTASSGKGVVLTRDIEVWSLSSIKPVVTCSLQLQYF